MRTHVDLFSGIGGFSIAAEWAGFTTVLFVEKDDYCQKVLRKHWPNVPLVEDIRDVTEETLADAEQQRRLLATSGGEGGQQPRRREGVSESRSETLADTAREGLEGEVALTELSGAIVPAGRDRGARDGSAGLPTIDLLTGGFPCQPFSVAGKRGGDTDNRFLWPEMCRVIGLLKPRWVLAENVAGIINMALDDVLSDLEGQGYEVGTVVLPACAVNAPHRRDRVWIVGHATGGGCSAGGGNQRGRHVCNPAIGSATENQQERGGRQLRTGEGSGREDVADTDERQREFADKAVCTGRDTANGSSSMGNPTGEGLPNWAGGEMGQPNPLTEFERPGGREIERYFRRVDDGLSDGMDGHTAEAGQVAPTWEEGTRAVNRRVDRLRCLGNAIVPAVAFEILRCMK